MATKTIFVPMHLKKKEQINRLLSALENAATHDEKKVIFSRTPSDMTPAEIRELFGTKK